MHIKYKPANLLSSLPRRFSILNIKWFCWGKTIAILKKIIRTYTSFVNFKNFKRVAIFLIIQSSILMKKITNDYFLNISPHHFTTTITINNNKIKIKIVFINWTTTTKQKKSQTSNLQVVFLKYNSQVSVQSKHQNALEIQACFQRQD